MLLQQIACSHIRNAKLRLLLKNAHFTSAVCCGIPNFERGKSTAHMLKPNAGEFEDSEINEHDCLNQGRKLA